MVATDTQRENERADMAARQDVQPLIVDVLAEQAEHHPGEGLEVQALVEKVAAYLDEHSTFPAAVRPEWEKLIPDYYLQQMLEAGYVRDDGGRVRLWLDKGK